jgi:hypothetical protein
LLAPHTEFIKDEDGRFTFRNIISRRRSAFRNEDRAPNINLWKKEWAAIEERSLVEIKI